MFYIALNASEFLKYSKIKFKLGLYEVYYMQ